MYCILVTGIPAAGKSTLAGFLSESLHLPLISKDQIKEIMYDDIGFRSRAEKVRLGIAGMNIMYYTAGQLMKVKQPFILENNFENVSRDGLMKLLDQYDYKAITITLSGDYRSIYQRFLQRNGSPERHRGHVVNDYYPEENRGKEENGSENRGAEVSYESFVNGIVNRGMDKFKANGPQILLDTTDFGKVDLYRLLDEIERCKRCFFTQ